MGGAGMEATCGCRAPLDCGRPRSPNSDRHIIERPDAGAGRVAREVSADHCPTTLGRLNPQARQVDGLFLCENEPVPFSASRFRSRFSATPIFCVPPLPSVASPARRPNFRWRAADDGEVPIYTLEFIAAFAAGAVALMFGVALLSIAIRRREYPGLAVFCALPGVALLAGAVVAFRFAYLVTHMTHIRIPPGG